MKSVNGVESVDVSLSKGLATVTLKPGNTVRTKQLLDAISKNGFTTKQSKLEISGVFVSDAAGVRLKVAGTDESFAVTGDAAFIERARSMVGKPVVVNGVIPEVPKGKLPETIRLTTIEPAKG
ncbi:MAG: Heavy metal transport/detoxification protein [Acidobacteriaceae bacterium]|nr:Heavy metal transport/detoxification protein [Acidobacteriaceae bacterium]